MIVISLRLNEMDLERIYERYRLESKDKSPAERV